MKLKQRCFINIRDVFCWEVASGFITWRKFSLVFLFQLLILVTNWKQNAMGIKNSMYSLLFSLVNYNLWREVLWIIKKAEATLKNTPEIILAKPNIFQKLSVTYNIIVSKGWPSNQPCLQVFTPVFPLLNPGLDLWLVQPVEQGGIDTVSFPGFSEDLEFYLLPLSGTSTSLRQLCCEKSKSYEEALEDETLSTDRKRRRPEKTCSLTSSLVKLLENSMLAKIRLSLQKRP